MLHVLEIGYYLDISRRLQVVFIICHILLQFSVCIKVIDSVTSVIEPKKKKKNYPTKADASGVPVPFRQVNHKLFISYFNTLTVKWVIKLSTYLGWKGLLKISRPISCSKKGQLQNCIRLLRDMLSFENLQGGRSHNIFGQLVPGLNHKVTRRNFFPMFS